MIASPKLSDITPLLAFLTESVLLNEMRFYPNHLLVISFAGSPVLIDWREQSFLLTFQGIPYCIAGSWRAGIVIISPCKISWCLYLAGKVDHIIISHRVETILILQYLMIFIEVRITARSSLLSISSHVAERRMIGNTLGYSAIQACSNNRQGSALASALHSHILTIPFRNGGQEVDAAHQSLINMLQDWCAASTS